MMLRFVGTSINTHDDDDEALRIRRREPISTIRLYIVWDTATPHTRFVLILTI